MVQAKAVPAKRLTQDMTVGGFIAYLQKFDTEAPIFFRDANPESLSARCRKPIQFSENLVKDGLETQLIVGLL